VQQGACSAHISMKPEVGYGLRHALRVNIKRALWPHPNVLADTRSMFPLPIPTSSKRTARGCHEKVTLLSLAGFHES